MWNMRLTPLDRYVVRFKEFNHCAARECIMYLFILFIALSDFLRDQRMDKLYFGSVLGVPSYYLQDI